MSENLLEVKNLKTYFFTDGGVVKSVDDVSFNVKPGKTLGVVGESGCGKSITSLSIMQLVETPPGKIVDGEIIYNGENLLGKDKDEMRKIRGGEIAMIFQEPMTSLNPVFTVGQQIMEALMIHTDMDKTKAKERAIEMLKLVRIPLAEKRFNEYPHQLSGGMRQRVMIAMALSCNPKLLICDEPTTALDVTIQAQILDLINELKEKLGTSIMMITHDLGVIAEVADDVMVMYAGKIVEYGTADQIFETPMHPYTHGLMNCIPKLNDDNETRLHVIPGMVPSPDRMPKGCAFCPRCSEAKKICEEKMPELIEIDGQKVRCFKYTSEWEEAK
ncbi:ABC transporter ATP-binding protein [Frisingicoccus caecimuris]|uniref:Peptide/nickel transport system ATP-binding protein/oligopeptide transport system ATP-binding protein n=1 Tax=Frisingicoccus caecimuris TaxID=1796636 RepID=A0A4R2LC17_9FIRM|nr:ABC transporter ATP-binding protein [Frisingicoccus caecimuris]MCR1917537.1 ABC transporter ATP-binding protein [Frisingicoccus caecimuris]TCO85807.1 peptide/nickel transport system ATP-binding protein/oligopeptide transport system ATP-binding protein [Frisingicoccus caecimuris]HAP19795.1 peptide ABC transporter ATP-binding protein [Lachnospiraceae bacterium]